MDATKYFPSQWLKAEDIGNRKIKVVIRDAVEESVGDTVKLVLVFDKFDKTLVLNRTNYERLKAEYGTDTDLWKGKTVELYTIKTNFRGQDVDAVRLQVIK